MIKDLIRTLYLEIKINYSEKYQKQNSSLLDQKYFFIFLRIISAKKKFYHSCMSQKLKLTHLELIVLYRLLLILEALVTKRPVDK